jgi:hypothetical protein
VVTPSCDEQAKTALVAEQIAGWLKSAHPGDETHHVSHETIYRSLFVQARGVLKMELLQHLRSKRTIRLTHDARNIGRAEIYSKGRFRTCHDRWGAHPNDCGERFRYSVHWKSGGAAKRIGFCDYGNHPFGRGLPPRI